ncbi:MAG: DNA replication protein [Alphaproteobacteria bacterium]|nr:DNA replication protein [Alphaproteobacteria bacterium]MCB9974370.1 DNA replication protein [Rhodospirillales bacterium]
MSTAKRAEEDSKTRKPKQIPFDLAFRPAMGREDFLIGQSNEAAVGWIDRWPDWSAPMLTLHGPAASGKTHLCAVWSARSNAAFIKPERLKEERADALFESGPALILDGLDPWIGDREAETTLFHLYNLLREERRVMLTTMRTPPSSLDFAIPDLASRFRAAPVATIRPPDDALLASLLIKQFADRQLKNVGEEVIHYILPRMERSFSSAREIVALADRMALAEKSRITVSLMRRVLSNLQEG